MSEMMSDDASDLSAVAAGDRAGFARLYERHAAVVLSLCRRCSTLGDAEDAAQDTFLRAFSRLGQVRNAEGFRRWLYAIARNVCAERRRSGRRRDRHENQASMNRLECEEAVSTASEVVDRAEQLERLGAALDSLDENERLAIHLYYLEPDPPEAAADAMGLSRSGFYKLVHRARHHLAVLMREAPIR